VLGGKSNNKGKSDPKRQLKVLLLDLYVAWLDDPTLCIGINRNNNAYAVNSRYNALHISRKIVDVVDVLAGTGYLGYRHGSHDRTNNGIFSRTSRIRPSLQLQDKFSELVLLPLDINHTETILAWTLFKQYVLTNWIRDCNLWSSIQQSTTISMQLLCRLIYLL